MAFQAHRGPGFDQSRRDAAAEAYAKVGTVRGAATLLGLSVSRTHRLLQEAGVDTSRKAKR